MKIKNVFDLIFSMENLYGALEDASDQRRYNKDVMLFNFNAWDNLKEIRDSVYDGTYTIDNVYLDALDQFCKRELQIHCYVRYMDDVIILSSSKAQLQEWKVRIASFLETELELQLNNKTCIRPINQGIEFVGYRVWPDKVVLRKKTTLHIKRVLKAKKEAYRVKEISFKQATDTLQSYLGMMKYCDCDALKEKILDDFVLTHADMKQIYEEGGDRDENYYRRGDGWSVEDYPVTDETYRPAGTCITAAWNY